MFEPIFTAFFYRLRLKIHRKSSYTLKARFRRNIHLIPFIISEEVHFKEKTNWRITVCHGLIVLDDKSFVNSERVFNQSQNSTFQNLLAIQKYDFETKCSAFEQNTFMDSDFMFENGLNNTDSFTSGSKPISAKCPKRTTPSDRPTASKKFTQKCPWNNTNYLFLGKDYQPSNWDVICVRGRRPADITSRTNWLTLK